MLAADGEYGVHSIRGKVDARPAELHLTRKYVAFLKNMFLKRPTWISFSRAIDNFYEIFATFCL
jgi:hypothetical protein